jgi:predicted transcriptional regulator of viral defense system
MPDELSLTRRIGGKPRVRPSDREISKLASRQYGIVSRAQLRDLGLGADAIDARLCGGRLCRLYRGVYAVGHGLLPPEGRWLAAVLRGGDGAVLSHGSAAALWGLRQETERKIDISMPRSTRLPMPIRRHVVGLASDEITIKRRIPVTTLVRTLFDIAAEGSNERLEAAIREAEYRHRFQLPLLQDFLERHPGRRGATAIKACLCRLADGPGGRTRSRLEIRFASLLARTQLPKPALNVLLDLGQRKIEADCLWREQRVVVELDGREPHGTRAAFEADRERDRRLQAAGWRVVRVTWHQLDDPDDLLADLARLLQ